MVETEAWNNEIYGKLFFYIEINWKYENIAYYHYYWS